MRRILSLVLVLSIILGVALPISAFAASGSDDAATPTQIEEPVDDSGGDSSDAAPSEDESAASSDTPSTDGTPSEALGTSSADDPAGDSALPFDPIFEATEDGGSISIMPLSGWEDEGNEFYTKISLTVTDRQGNPIEGAVYGLYRADNDRFVEFLKTDRYGEATSSDVPADTDYYLIEEFTPEGFLPNEERKDIILTEVCAPSLIVVTAVYDPIMGRIHVVKDDQDGNPLENVGFYVYRVDGWELVDTIYTDEYGEAWTTWLPYSPNGYELYEFSAPDDFVTGGYYSANVIAHEADETVYITNYRATGSARIHKSATDGRNVQGAVYSIYRIPQIQAAEFAADSVDDGGEWVCDITTGSSGYAYAYNLPMGDLYAVEKSVPSPYKLDTTPQYFSLSYDGEWAYLDFVNEVDGEAGRLRLLKTDDSGNYLSDFTFDLYRAWDNKKLAELTTGATGIAEYYPLIPQDYYLLEKSGKEGYQMVTDRIPFTVDGSGETVEVVVENPKIRVFGKVKVVKTDDAGAFVPGTRVGVYCKWGNLLEELVIGEDGSATSGILNAGSDYYIMELEAMPGHLPDTEKHYFDITENGVVVTVNLVNPRVSGGIRVTKYGNGEEVLPGPVFGVYQDGRLLERLTISEDGTAESGILYYGDFELIELSTVEGYELIETPIPFSITEDGVILEIEVTNPLIMGTIVVIKTDGDIPVEVEDDADATPENDNMPAPQNDTDAADVRYLPGAVFGLYNEQGQKLADLVTSEDGTASYPLPKGSFYLKELVSPEGFLLTDELIPFTIETQGQVVEKVVVNVQGYGTVKVMKSDDGGENAQPLPGVGFDVFREATEEKVGEIVTLEDGTAALDLPLGRYYLVETVAVEGFQLLPGRVSFALTEDGATVELAIANQRIPEPEDSGILLTKTSAADAALLPGAGFDVFDAATDEKVGEIITGPDGTARISLPASDYYLLERIVPEGFLLSEDKIPVTVVEEKYTEITVENEPDEPDPGELRVIKHAAGTGQRLPDTRFGVYDASTDEKVGEITTSENGVASISLPEGDFYLIELAAATGFKLNPEPVSFEIVAGETTKLAIANESETPAEDIGTVRFIKEDEDKKRLPGAVIGVYKSGTDEKVAELAVDKNGVVEYDLAAADYYWKELRAPEGFALLEGKTTFTIKANETREIIVVNEALPDDTGRLLLIKKGAGTGDGIGDAVFGVYLASNNRKVGEITTDDSGEGEIALEPNRYYLKELSVPSPWVLEPDKIPFTIKTKGTTVTIEVSNTKGIGELLLEKSSTEGGPVAGSVFTLYRKDGTRVAELVSGRDGTATYELPVGSYYLVEKTAAVGFQLDTTRHSFTIKNKQTSTVKVTNAPIEGKVEVYFKHVDDGRELATMQSLTGKIGTDYIKWMREKGYENMQINGYTLVRTDYPASLVLIDGTLVVTLWYDDPAAPITDKPGGGIEIPKTGEPYPIIAYTLSLLCWLVATFCAVRLVKGRNPVMATAGIPMAVEEPEPPAAPARALTQATRQNTGKSKKKRKKRRK